MNIIIDLDGVICTEEKTFERSFSKLISGANNVINDLYNKGNVISIYTARSWSEEKITKKWLDDNNIKYNNLIMGKPIADIWIDDRAIRFENWNKISAFLDPNIKNDYNLFVLRKETKEMVQSLQDRKDLIKPILEIGPNNKNSNIFIRMPDTYFDTKSILEDCITMDIDKSTGCDLVGDITNLYNSESNSLIKKESIGVIICNSVFEHIPEIWKVPEQLYYILKENGKIFCINPWALRLHGPRPDCWRISDDGFNALFGKYFDIKIKKIGEDQLNPIAFSVEMTKL